MENYEKLMDAVERAMSALEEVRSLLEAARAEEAEAARVIRTEGLGAAPLEIPVFSAVKDMRGAASLAAKRCSEWEYREIMGLPVDESLLRYSCEEEDRRNPTEPNDPRSYYLVSADGGIGRTDDDGAHIDWIFIPEGRQRGDLPASIAPVSGDASEAEPNPAPVTQPEPIPAPIPEPDPIPAPQPEPNPVPETGDLAFKDGNPPFCPPAPEPAPQVRFCRACGTPLGEHSRFCKNCGARVES